MMGDVWWSGTPRALWYTDHVVSGGERPLSLTAPGVSAHVRGGGGGRHAGSALRV